MASLFLRNLFFTILQPGIVAGLVPFLMIRYESKGDILDTIGLSHLVGGMIFLIGFLLMMTCIINFAVKGKGTISPADPTKRLVTAGPYVFSRNPMYVGVMLILIGEAIFFQSFQVWRYLFFTFIAFNLFIMLREEPRLRRDFGEEYIDYCKRVRRWI
jgi:protein-S-isoprenylcysteine O-methyltransferase Ste14